MIRLITLLLIPALLALAIACDEGDDDGVTARTQTEIALESPGPPPPPNGTSDEGAQFSGSASIDGEALFDGATIIAQVDGYNCGSGFVTDGLYDVTVASDEAKGGCGTAGATVTFVLGGEGDPGGTEADQTGTWDDSQLNELDITFTTE